MYKDIIVAIAILFISGCASLNHSIDEADKSFESFNDKIAESLDG